MPSSAQLLYDWFYDTYNGRLLNYTRTENTPPNGYVQYYIDGCYLGTLRGHIWTSPLNAFEPPWPTEHGWYDLADPDFFKKLKYDCDLLLRTVSST